MAVAVAATNVGDETTAAYRNTLKAAIDDLYSRLNTAGDVVELEPGGNLDSGSSGTFTSWIPVGSLTVPSWAHGARYLVTVAGVVLATAAKAGFVRIAIGGQAGRDHAVDLDSTTIREDVSWQGRVSGLTPGTAAVTVEFSSATGTGVFRVDTNSHIAVSVVWEP